MKITTSEFIELQDCGEGYCPTCDDCVGSYFEPDARDRECPICGNEGAMGMGEALIEDHLEIDEDNP